MLFPRNVFVVKFSFFKREGLILDALSQEPIIRIENRTKFDIGSKIINFLTFRFLGGMRWDFIFNEQIIFKVNKKFFDNYLWFEYNFEGKFCELYKVNVSNSLLPFASVINIEGKDGDRFICRRKNFLDYEILGGDGLYCVINKRGGWKPEYYVKIKKMLEGFKNYLFLGMPVIIDVFY